MPERPESLATCQSCGKLMNVEKLAPFANVICPNCGVHNRVKCEFGPYTLVRRHAIGGMSMVFVAHDPTLDREVALKILSEEFSTDERRIAAFEEEARITASFSHPHVVRVLTTGKAFGRLYIAMELVPGGHFERRIQKLGKVPELEMLPLAIEVAEGLKAAHSAGLIHRDIKPGNILLDAEGHARIVDFGLSLVTQGGKAKAAEIWATPYYVPPETIEGYPEDFRSDIYAFGATLYHALSGVPSCNEETMGTQALREAKQKVVPLGITDPTLSESLCAIVDKAMAYSPDDRFSSYDDVIHALESALKRLTTGADAESSGSAARRRAKKKRTERITMMSVAGILLVGISAGIWWVTRNKPEPVIQTPKVRIDAGGKVDPVTPGMSAGEIARNYRAARAAVEQGEFATAAGAFEKLRNNEAVQEPTRSWAGVEAVIADFLDGDASRAKMRALLTLSHARSVAAGDTRLGDYVLNAVEETGDLAAISPTDLDTTQGDAAHVMGWMVAGLKNWEQGCLTQAKPFFQAVADAELSANDAWLSLYQDFARKYLKDGEAMASGVFQDLPADVAGCEAAVAELDRMVDQLVTRGRARFNVRAWQLDVRRHAKILSEQAAETADVKLPGVAEVMGKLTGYAADCRFEDASNYLKSLEEDTDGATRASLEWVTESSSIFLTDLKEDLGKQTVSGDFSLKSGKAVRKIGIDANEQLVATDEEGGISSVSWCDLSATTLISLHRIFVTNAMPETLRVRRHECAIAYDWLAGNRERALSAAAVLSQSSSAFKEHWDAVSSGLPK